MGKNDERIKKIDFTTPEEKEKLRKYDAEVEEERRKEQERVAREAEEERKRQEKDELDYHKIKREINRKKFEDNPPPFKPSRMIDIESDVAIMNIETMVTSIKENVEFLENKLWEIEDYLCRHDKEKRESLKLEKMKRKEKKR